MAVTEMEQSEAEIAAIFSVRPARDCDTLDRLEVGKEMMSEVFLFAQYRGFALYDGLVANFKMAWDDEEDGPPPLSCWLRLTERKRRPRPSSAACGRWGCSSRAGSRLRRNRRGLPPTPCL